MDELNLQPTSLEEQETMINIDYAQKQAFVYSSRANVARQLLRMCEEHPDCAAVETNNRFGVSIKVPIDWIVIKPKVKRQMTDEQKQVLADRLALARSKKQ